MPICWLVCIQPKRTSAVLKDVRQPDSGDFFAGMTNSATEKLSLITGIRDCYRNITALCISMSIFFVLIVIS